MIVKERNTKKFKDIVNTIIVNRGELVATLINTKQKYNFNIRGEIKNIRIDGVNYDNIISYYWVNDGSSRFPIRYVTYDEYLSFLRSVKVSGLVGVDMQIVSKVSVIKKKCEFNDFIPEPSMYLKYNGINVVITKVTPKQFKFMYLNVFIKEEFIARISSLDGKWESNGYSFEVGQYTKEEREIMHQRKMNSYY